MACLKHTVLMESLLVYRHLAWMVFASAALIATPPVSAAEPRAVIELFTSQGCSSCPPADKLLDELSHDPSVIALSLPVDYWDYLGWKDTLALPGHTRRQRAYSRVRGDREVFTPQAVINGAAYALGSNKAAIEEAIVRTRAASTINVPVTLAVAGERITVDIAAVAGGNGGEIWLCPVTRKVDVAIGRGENHDRDITYTNVVRGWLKLGDWNGKAASFAMPVTDIMARSATADAVVVLVQDGSAAMPGRIVGAASAPLH
jgi:hypothetical protein